MVALVKQNVGVDAVPLAQAAEPPQQQGHVAAEHAAEHVQLVDHDVAQAHEEGRPAGVVRQDPRVEHVGVGHDHRRRPAGPRPLARAVVSPS